MRRKLRSGSVDNVVSIAGRATAPAVGTPFSAMQHVPLDRSGNRRTRGAVPMGRRCTLAHLVARVIAPFSKSTPSSGNSFFSSSAMKRENKSPVSLTVHCLPLAEESLSRIDQQPASIAGDANQSRNLGDKATQAPKGKVDSSVV